MKRPPTSCIMLHTVGVPDPAWEWQFLTLPWPIFEGMLRLLKRTGYRSVLLPEYQEIFLQNRLRKERVVCFTFDDGYLDNWVYGAVLLEKYGFNGTVFVSGDFIDPGLETRPQWNPERPNEAPASSGYLNVPELRALDKSGLIDVQSHAMTHTWYPCGPRIIDFRHPGDSYHWMDWNAEPENKWRHIQPPQNPERWGEPVYEHQKALEGPRYHPNQDLTEELRAHAAKQGPAFFKRSDWRGELTRKAEQLQAHFPPGERESEAEFLQRAEWELARSSELLSEKLDKKIKYLCWPGGGYHQEIMALSAKYYAATTISSHDKGTLTGLDKYGCFRIRRLGPLHVERKGRHVPKTANGKACPIHYLGPWTNLLYLEELRSGNRLARLLRGALTRFFSWSALRN